MSKRGEKEKGTEARLDKEDVMMYSNCRGWVP